MKTVTKWKNKLKNMLQKHDIRLLRDISYNAAGKIVAMISFFSLDIAVARLLGYNFYNEWNFAFSIITGFRWIARFGIDSSGKSYVASSKAHSSDYMAAALDLQVLFGIIFVISAEGALWIGYTFFNPFPQYRYLKSILTLGAVYAGLYALYSTLREGFVGKVEFRKVFILTACEYLGYLAIGIPLMYLQGILGLAAAFGLSMLVTVILGNSLRQSPKLPYMARKSQRIAIFQYAKYIAFANVGDLILTEMDSLMLGVMKSSEVGIYAVGKNLITKATNLPLIICISCMPEFALLNRKNVAEKERKYRNIIKKNLLLTGMVAALFIILGRWYVSLFYGAEYKDSYPVICILQIYYILYGLSMYQTTFLNYQKNGKRILVSQAVLVATNLVLNIALIPHYGALGAALATGAAIVPSCMIQSGGIKLVFKRYKIEKI